MSWTEDGHDQCIVTESTSFGFRYPMEIRKACYSVIINELDKFGFENYAICKDTLQLFNELGLDWRAQKCNCME